MQGRSLPQELRYRPAQNQLLLRVKRLEGRPSTIRIDHRFRWLRELMNDVFPAITQHGPSAEIIFDLVPGADHVRMGLTVALPLTPTCDVCLDPYPDRLQFSVDLVCRAAEDMEQDVGALSAGERQYLAEDAETIPFTQGEIDLTDICREQINLFRPQRFRCRETCLGLCPRCGVNLNRLRCDCTRGDLSASAWGKLRDYRPSKKSP